VLKLIIDKDKRNLPIIGVSIFGPDACELIHYGLSFYVSVCVCMCVCAFPYIYVSFVLCVSGNLCFLRRKREKGRNMYTERGKTISQ